MIKPCGHKLVVKPIEVEEKTKGGIILPETVKENEQRNVVKGIITEIGSQCWKEFSDGKPWAEVGDKIVFARHSGIILKDEEDEKEYRVINDEDVICIIERAN